MCINSTYPQNNHMKCHWNPYIDKERWKHWSSQWLSNLPKITQPVKRQRQISISNIWTPHPAICNFNTRHYNWVLVPEYAWTFILFLIFYVTFHALELVFFSFPCFSACLINISTVIVTPSSVQEHQVDSWRFLKIWIKKNFSFQLAVPTSIYSTISPFF